MDYKGGCHCGRISFEVEGDLDKAMECNCSHCSCKGYLLWFVPREDFALHSPDSELSTYTFNKHVIKHHFCPTCGCAPFASGADRSGKETVAINVRCLKDVELSDLQRVPVDGRA